MQDNLVYGPRAAEMSNQEPTTRGLSHGSLTQDAIRGEKIRVRDCREARPLGRDLVRLAVDEVVHRDEVALLSGALDVVERISAEWRIARGDPNPRDDG